MVISAGTGGTLTGISRKLKELNPEIQIIAIDPAGSILAQPEELNAEGIHSYKVEGIGYDFIPRVLDRQFTDKWYKIDDPEAFEQARRIIREEGMFVGGSSGTAMAGALKAIKDLNIGEGKRVVVVFPDSVRNYMTKFINNDWMYENGFITEEECIKQNTSTLVQNKDWGQEYTVKDLELHDAVFLSSDLTVKQAIKEINKHSFDQFPVKHAQTGNVIGCITSTHLTTRLIKKKTTLDEILEKNVIKEYRNVSSSITLNELGRIFTRHNFAFVDNKYIVSSFDLLNFIREKY